MRRNTILFLFAALLVGGTLLASDLYWVGFNGTGGTTKYLMAIDENGNIVKPPTKILLIDGKFTTGPNPFGETVEGPLAALTAMALTDKPSNPGQLCMYLLTVQGSVFRYDISKTTLKPTTKLPIELIKRATLSTKSFDFRSFTATQHASNRFLAMSPTPMGPDSDAFDNPRAKLFSYPLNANDTINLTGGNRLSPRTDGHHKAGGISSDGLMAISSAENSNYDDADISSFAKDNDFADKIYSQVISATGSPVGTPSVIADAGGNKSPSNSGQVSGVDVSNPLSGGVRFVVFATRSLDTPDSSNGDDLVLQKINATTGVKVGSPIKLLTDDELILTMMQGVAVDPDGRFVLFTRRPVLTDPNTDPSGDVARDSLFFQKLNADGTANGNPKELFDADDGPCTGKEDESAPCNGQGAIPQITMIDLLKD